MPRRRIWGGEEIGECRMPNGQVTRLPDGVIDGDWRGVRDFWRGLGMGVGLWPRLSRFVAGRVHVSPTSVGRLARAGAVSSKQFSNSADATGQIGR
jgi:hypothetical protein